MACIRRQSLSKALWALARRQHGVVARWQSIELGASRTWIRHESPRVAELLADLVRGRKPA